MFEHVFGIAQLAQHAGPAHTRLEGGRCYRTRHDALFSKSSLVESFLRRLKLPRGHKLDVETRARAQVGSAVDSNGQAGELLRGARSFNASVGTRAGKVKINQKERKR